MKNKFLTLTAAAIMGVFTLLGAPVSAATITVGVGESIQAAIDSANPGDVINVAAGTFTESVVINKAITLNGAQAGTDARTRTGGETVLAIPAANTAGITVSSSDVTVSGFTIDGAAATAPSGVAFSVGTRESVTISHNIITNTRNAIMVPTGAEISGFTASYNLITETNNTTSGSNGVYLGNSIGTGIEISNNAFENTEAAGSNNAIQVVAATPGGMSDVTITGNSSDNDGSFVFLTRVDDVTIADNTATGLAGHGVLVGASTTNVLVSSNEFTESQTGVRINGADVENIAIVDNTISGMTLAAVSVGAATTGGPITLQDNTMTDNAVNILNDSQTEVTVADTPAPAPVAPAAPVDNEAAPGVPNTGTAGADLLPVAGLGASISLLGALFVLRRYVRS